MTEQNSTEKQPSTQPDAPPEHVRERTPWWLLAILFVFLLSATVSSGALAGYQSGQQTRRAQLAGQIQKAIQEQYELGMQDFHAGHYPAARTRFEYILILDPTHPGAIEKLAEAEQILHASATPTPSITFTLSPTASSTPSPSPTLTLTPTPDLRPVEELLSQAESHTANRDWDAVIDTLVALRKVDRSYQVTRVDDLLFVALRQRGVEKILLNGDLEGGMYDLSLAERFGPLDVEANNARTWARLYVIGLSFWEVHPEQALYYFEQVAGSIPYLRDLSGWTANERYRATLIQYGDLLASQGSWCDAQSYYQVALNIRSEQSLAEILKQAIIRCSPPTPTKLQASSTPLSTPTPSTTPSPPLVQPTATLTEATPPNIAPSDTPLPPTATSISPTATPLPPPQPVPPTATPLPPTATPLPPTDTPLPPVATPTHTMAPATNTPLPPTDTPQVPKETPTTSSTPTMAAPPTPTHTLPPPPPTETPTATFTPEPPTDTPISLKPLETSGSLCNV